MVAYLIIYYNWVLILGLFDGLVLRSGLLRMFSRYNHPVFPDLEGKRITHFSEVLYYVVDGRSTDSIISWGKTGKSFVVWNLDKFCSDVLPKFQLRAHNLPIFIRKLESYVSFFFFFDFVLTSDEIKF